MKLQIIGLLVLMGCNGAGKPRDTPSVATPKDGFSEDPLAIAAFGGNVFAENQRFAGYSSIAKRVSIIDPTTEREQWGRRVGGGYSGFFPLPGTDGVGLVSESEFRAVSQKEEKRFATAIDTSRWRWARGARAAVFNNPNGQTARVIRHLDDANWESVTIDYPTEAMQGTAPAPLITSDGMVVVELFSQVGGYVVHRAKSASAGLQKQSTCEPPEENDDSGVAALDEIYAAGVAGNSLLVTFDTTAAWIDISADADCAKLSALEQTAVVDEGPLRRVLFVDDDAALLASESGEVVKVSIADNGRITVAKDYGNVCDLPVGLNEISDELMVVTCVTAFDDDDQVTDIALLVMNQSSGKVLYEAELALAKLAAVAIDPVALKLFQFRDGGLGELIINDLASGETRAVRGIFTKGILENL